MSPHCSAAPAAWLAVPYGGLSHSPHPPHARSPHTQPSVAGAGSCYDPEELAALDAAQARALIAALSPPQRVAQAIAYAAWLNEFGYGVSIADVLSAWEHRDTPTDDRTS